MLERKHDIQTDPKVSECISFYIRHDRKACIITMAVQYAVGLSVPIASNGLSTQVALARQLHTITYPMRNTTGSPPKPMTKNRAGRSRF